MVAGTRDAVVMVEGRADEMSEDVVLEAIFFAHAGIQPLIDLQVQLQKKWQAQAAGYRAHGQRGPRARCAKSPPPAWRRW